MFMLLIYFVSKRFLPNLISISEFQILIGWKLLRLIIYTYKESIGGFVYRSCVVWVFFLSEFGVE